MPWNNLAASVLLTPFGVKLPVHPAVLSATRSLGSQCRQVILHRKPSLYDGNGVAIAASIMVESHEPLDDDIAVGIGELAHTPVFAPLALGNVRLSLPFLSPGAVARK